MPDKGGNNEKDTNSKITEEELKIENANDLVHFRITK